KDNTQMLTAFSDYVTWWDTYTGKIIYNFTHEETVQDALFHPSQRMIITQTNKNVYFWPRVDGPNEPPTIKFGSQKSLPHNADISLIHFNNSQTKVLSAAKDKVVRLWDIESQTIKQEFEDNDDVI